MPGVLLGLIALAAWGQYQGQPVSFTNASGPVEEFGPYFGLPTWSIDSLHGSRVTGTLEHLRNGERVARYRIQRAERLASDVEDVH